MPKLGCGAKERRKNIIYKTAYKEFVNEMEMIINGNEIFLVLLRGSVNFKIKRGILKFLGTSLTVLYKIFR
jgi:hypothetical protein